MNQRLQNGSDKGKYSSSANCRFEQTKRKEDTTQNKSKHAVRCFIHSLKHSCGDIKDGGRYLEYETESKQVAYGSVARTTVESAHQVTMHSVLGITFFPSIS